LQFSLKPFPFRHVQPTRFLAGIDQSSYRRGVVPITLQVRDHLALPRDVPGVSRNMPFDFQKVRFLHWPVHSDFLLRMSPP
jgi:hypothetical protein